MGTKTSKIAVIAAITTLWPTLASPQQGGAGTSGGLQVDIGLSSTIKADSNFQLKPGGGTGSTEIWDTNLSYGISSTTNAYDFQLLGTGVLRFADIPGRTIRGFEDPTVKLRFVADSANSRLTLDGRYRSVDREFLNPFKVEQEEQQLGTLVGSGGTLTDTSLGLKYETGLNAPLGFVLDLNHRDKSYQNLSTTSLFDTVTDSVTGTVSLRLSPVAVGRLSAGQTNYRADDLAQTDRTTTDLSMGIAYDMSASLHLDAQVGHTEVETQTGLTTNTKSGLNGAVTLTQDLTNGTVFGSISSVLNQNGKRVSLTFGRDLQLPTGNLRATVGLTDADVGRSAVIGTLAYSKQLSNGTLDLSVRRSASTNNLNQEILDTRVGAALGFPVNATSQLKLSFDYGRSEDAGSTGVPTIQTSNLTAAYSHDLTSDWSLTGGMTLRTRTETGLADAQSTALFVTIDRTFSYRP